MGLGFVLVIHLGTIYLLCLFISNFTIDFSNKIKDKEKRERVRKFLKKAPFVGIYTLYFCGFVGSIIISAKTGVDIGIGECWYIPISKQCSLSFIDSYDQGFIQCKRNMEISQVSYLKKVGEKIYIKTLDSNYYVIDAKVDSLTKLSGAKDVENSNNYKSASDYYDDLHWKLAGIPYIIDVIISVSMSVFFVFLVWRKCGLTKAGLFVFMCTLNTK